MDSVTELEPEQRDIYGPKQSTPYKTVSLHGRRAVNSPSYQSPLGLKCHAKVRTDYLRTVLSPHGKTFSPSGKNGSPVPQTPLGISPVLKTPVRDSNFSHSYQYTPQGTTPPSWHSSAYNRTNNPFESGHTELQLPTFLSPGIFAVSSTPSPAGGKPFRWSIEHLAVLHPADIDEMPRQDSVDVMTDVEMEKKAQTAIDHFFANHLIIPSPWSSSSKKTGKKTGGPVTPMESLEPELQGSIQKQLLNNKPTQEVSCQTMLTFPANLDISKVLASYMTYESSDEVNQDVMSTSSLRRKLFFQGDTSSLAISPVRDGAKNASIAEECRSPRLSPFRKATTEFEQETPAKTPNMQFASSPIVEMPRTPTRTQSFSNMDALASPELVYQQHSTEANCSRSSGVFCSHQGSFQLSPVLANQSSTALHKDNYRSSTGSLGLSPIRPMHNRNRSSRSEKLPRPLMSPNMSPIGPSQTGRSMNHEGSFIQTDQDNVYDSDSEHDKSTPVAAYPESPDRVLRMTTDMASPNYHDELEHTTMDFESAPIVKNLRFTDDIRTSSLLGTRDFSMLDNTECAAENLTNQDTGYHTASIQSTNQDMGLHTNLTCQFSSLPFNTTSQDTGYHTNSIQSLSQEDLQTSSTNQEYQPIKQTYEPHHTDLREKLFDLHRVNSDGKLHITDHLSLNFKSQDDLLLSNRHISRHKQLQMPGAFVKDRYVSDVDVIRRAKQVLGTEDILREPAHLNLTPCVHQTGLSMLEMEPQHCSTPQKTSTGSHAHQPAPQSASEIAMAVLRRAEEDLAKFGQLHH